MLGLYLLCRLFIAAATLGAILLLGTALASLAVLAAIATIPVLLVVGIVQGYRQQPPRTP